MSQPLNPARPGTQHELTQHLSETIGADVLAAMEGVNWEPTVMSPPIPPRADPANPAPAAAPVAAAPPANPAPAVDAAPALNWDEFRDPSGFILGKYKDPAQAVKGMHSLLHLAKDALSQRDEALARLSTPPVSTTPAPAPSVPAALVDPEIEALQAKMREDGGLTPEDLATLTSAIVRNAERVAREQIAQDRQAQTVANQRWSAVDQVIAEKHPWAFKHADEMHVFRRASPDVSRVYDRLLNSGDDHAELDASVYLAERYAQANPHVLDAAAPDAALQQQERELQIQGQVRQEEVDKARLHAGLGGGNIAGGVHTTPNVQGVSQEEIDSAARVMQQTKDGRSWRNLTIGRTLTHPIFDDPNQ
jgi:hypothetical protein